MYQADLAERRGLLRGPDMSAVQIAVLTTVMVREREVDAKQEEQEFERMMMVHNPLLYQEYLRSRDGELTEEEEDSQVEWRVPTNAEEARLMALELEAMERKAAPIAAAVEEDEMWDRDEGDWVFTSGDIAEMGD